MAFPRGKHNSVLRRVATQILETVLLGGAVARTSYRLGWHGRLAVSHHTVEVSAERRLPRPLHIAFASDFHAGPTTDPRLFDECLAVLNQLQPDLLLLGGDFVSHAAADVAALTTVLAQCNPPLGKFAVLGNHDLWTDDGEISRRLAAVAVEVLVNRTVKLPSPFGSVSICGIDDPFTGEANARCAFSGAGPVRIFLSHSPDGLLLLDGQRYDVGFAGHTHGGQIALPDGTPIVDAGGPLARSHSRGRFDVEGNGPLIVSRGVGCSMIPLRIHADPEIVFCRLR